MPDYIIDRVHQLAEQEHAPELDADGCPIFEWELGVPFEANNPIIPPDQLSGDDLSIDDESYLLKPSNRYKPLHTKNRCTLKTVGRFTLTSPATNQA